MGVLLKTWIKNHKINPNLLNESYYIFLSTKDFSIQMNFAIFVALLN